MFAAEVQHLLRLPDAADERAVKILPAKNQTAGVNRKRFRRNTDLRERAVAFQQRKVGIDVVLRRHGIEEEMKTVRLRRHLGGIL